MASRLTGHCHCKAVIFDIPFAGEFKKVSRCNCSFCAMRWAAVATVPVDELNIIQGQETLSLYQWHSETAKHYFCSICGIYTFHQRRSRPDEYGVNIACFDNVNTADYMDVRITDGQNHSKDK